MAQLDSMSSAVFGLFDEQSSYVITSEPSVAAGAKAIRLYYSLLTPSSQRVGMYAENSACLSSSKHVARFLHALWHAFSHL